GPGNGVANCSSEREYWMRGVRVAPLPNLNSYSAPAFIVHFGEKGSCRPAPTSRFPGVQPGSVPGGALVSLMQASSENSASSQPAPPLRASAPKMAWTSSSAPTASPEAAFCVV